MPAVHRYAFAVDVPGEENYREYGTAGENLTAEEAVERTYDALPEGSSIVKVLRGDVPDGVDLSEPEREEGAEEEPDEEDDG